MTAYVVGHVKVLNSDLWNQYRESVPKTFKPFQAEVIIRGKKIKCLSGKDLSSDQIVIIKFPNQETIDLWYESTAYQDLICLRDDAADVQLFLYTNT